MKKQFFLIVMIIFTTFANSFSQTVTTDKNGNYIQSKTVDTANAIPTGKTFTTTKGEIYPVYKTKTGKLYVVRTSKKTGNKYKQYLKL